jgi:phospholipid/cholesterol/gamma-HCH transport system ATP-binding protein
MSAPAVRFDGVAWSWEGEACMRDLSFAVERGEALVLAGGGSSGKSTALALCLGGRRADAGTVEVLGVDPAALGDGDRDALRARIGYVPQRGGLLANLTLHENIALPAAYHRRLDRARAEQAVAQVHRLLGLDPLPALLPGDAPRLLRQVAAIARALVLEPELLLVDEPGAGLDEAAAEELWRLLWRVQSETGTAVLATVADARLAETLTDRVVVLPERRRLSFTLIPGVG